MRDFVYRGSDGCRLHATALGHGPAVVLLRGGGPDRYSLLPVARRLADGFTVVLPDVRGYGRSVCTGPARHTWAQYAEDVDALLDHLGLRRAALGGTSLGGTITLRAAAVRPDRVRAAVVIGTADIRHRGRRGRRGRDRKARGIRRPHPGTGRPRGPRSPPADAGPRDRVFGARRPGPPAPSRHRRRPRHRPAPSLHTGRRPGCNHRAHLWSSWTLAPALPRPWPPGQPAPCRTATSPACPCPPARSPRPTWPTPWHRPSGTSSPPI